MNHISTATGYLQAECNAVSLKLFRAVTLIGKHLFHKSSKKNKTIDHLRPGLD